MCLVLKSRELSRGPSATSARRERDRATKTALVLGDAELAARRVLARRLPRAARRSHRQHAKAAELDAEAAGRWRTFGNVPELAYALLGQGRCLGALGNPEAETPLHEACELFASMGYEPALTKTVAVLGDSEAAAV